MSKLILEAKENLPLAFLTNLISRGWDEVGLLKEQKEVIKNEFKNTKMVEQLLQNLIDAYLICIGQTEAILQNKQYIEFPDETSDIETK